MHSIGVVRERGPVWQTAFGSFNGCHADHNLTYDKELVAIMGLVRKKSKLDVDGPIPSFGVAAVFCHAF